MIVRIWTLQRGKIEPPERVSEFTEFMVETLPQREAQERLIAEQAHKAELWAMRMKGEG